MPILLQARDIHKSYLVLRNRLDVLRGVSLHVEDGESVAVAGVSGAGKSTLLHILGGLDRPDRGQVEIGGRDLYGAAAGRRCAIRSRQIGFVFQSYHLLPEMDVLENVMLPALAAAGIFTAIAGLRDRAASLLSAVGLRDRAAHRPMELSGGEQQRVAIARALMNEPALVLADEPTGNLDEKTGGQVMNYLFSLTQKRGHALLLVTHDRRIAARCDRVLNLEGGLIGHDA